MKSIINYLEGHGNKYEHDVLGREFTIELDADNIRLKCKGNEWLINCNPVRPSIEWEIMDILEEQGISIRICEECGIPMDEGFMVDDGSFYSCESCFESAMDKTYGKGNWRGTDEEGEWGGYYEYLDVDIWEDTGIFWTQWF